MEEMTMPHDPRIGLRSSVSPSHHNVRLDPIECMAFSPSLVARGLNELTYRSGTATVMEHPTEAPLTTPHPKAGPKTRD